ncbi:hypothetical protein LFX25_18995 [Leptospira sp. FAT2]|uniref:hypothetical protein n=1 Tax=Leptospira sanjuanensis TaxID=2879643 RepID=UPI001EE99C9B|nr:hypothetical protein [Leptospira sanjuanensis]MCG6195332.1 hypothetical protein [Leptospira sanjuanensis]
MVLKNTARIVLFLLVVCTATDTFSENANPSPFRTGILLLKDGSAFSGEVGEFQEYYFIRNSKIGKKIPKEQIVDFVSEEYYKNIKNSSAFRSAWESLLYWNASADAQWKGFPNESVAPNGQFENSYTLWVKVGLVLLTAAAYVDTNQQNQSLKNSYSGFNDKEKHTFQNSYTRYQTLAAITVGFFTFTTIKAYVRFGKNETYKDLQIQNRELKPIGEGTDTRSSSFGIPAIQLGITHHF